MARQFLIDRGLRRLRRRDLRQRLRPPGRRGAAARAARAGLHRRRERRGRPGRDRPLGVRPVPRAAALADPRRVRRHDRLRRAPDPRRRQDRGEVPQHPRDRALQEEPGALRHRPRPARDGAGVPGGRGRGLHRRDGLPPRRRPDRRRDLRHRLRRRPRAGAAALPPRPRGLPRRGHLHLRRRLRRPEGGAAAFDGDQNFVSQTYVAVEPERARPVRPAPEGGRRRGPRARRPPGAALPVRARQHHHQVRPRPRRRPHRRHARGCPTGLQHPRPVQGRRLRPRAREQGRRRDERGARGGTSRRLPAGPPSSSRPARRPAGGDGRAAAAPAARPPRPAVLPRARDPQARGPAPRFDRQRRPRRRRQRLHPPDVPRRVGAGGRLGRPHRRRSRRGLGGPAPQRGDRPGGVVGDQRARGRAAAHARRSRTRRTSRPTSSGSRS